MLRLLRDLDMAYGMEKYQGVLLRFSFKILMSLNTVLEAATNSRCVCVWRLFMVGGLIYLARMK